MLCYVATCFVLASEVYCMVVASSNVRALTTSIQSKWHYYILVKYQHTLIGYTYSFLYANNYCSTKRFTVKKVFPPVGMYNFLV
jgi:hypothetical protein